MSFNSLLNKRATIQRLTRTSDGAGGFTEVWSNLYENIPCRVQPKSGLEQAKYSALKTVVTHVLYCNGNWNIIEADRVVFENKNFNVVFVKNPDHLLHHLEVEMYEVKPSL